ncbi:MAG: hypothetical protein WBQ79_11660, partial [Acidobacteriaceae bacterium]
FPPGRKLMVRLDQPLDSSSCRTSSGQWLAWASVASRRRCGRCGGGNTHNNKEAGIQTEAVLTFTVD